MIYKLLFILIFISSFHGFAQEDSLVKIVDTLKQDHEAFTNAAKKVNFANTSTPQVTLGTNTTYMEVESKMNRLNIELKTLNSSKVTPEKVSRLYNHLSNLQHKINKDMNTPEMEDFVKKYNSHITHLKTQLAPHTPHTAAVIDMLNYHEKGLETANGKVHTAENLRTMVGNMNLSPNDHPVNKKALKETREKYAKLNRYMKKIMDQKAEGKLIMTEPELRKLHKKLESFKIDVTKQDPVGQKKWELYHNINKLKAQGKDTTALEKELTKLAHKPHVHSNIVALSEHHNAHIENLQKHLQQPHLL